MRQQIIYEYNYSYNSDCFKRFQKFLDKYKVHKVAFIGEKALKSSQEDAEKCSGK